MNRRIYLANVAHEFVPRRALRVLDSLGWSAHGNFFDALPSLEAFQPDVVVYVPTRRPDAVSLARVDELFDVPLLIWALYPDQLIGWDVRTNSFGEHLDPVADVLFREPAMRLANSRFSKSLLEDATGLKDFRVCPLGIDTTGILNAAGRRSDKDRATSVLWNHRWSADKNLATALDVFLELAARYPDVTFYLGRSGDWQPCYVPETLRQEYRRFEAAARRHENLLLLPRFPTRRTFWRFLRDVDIGFSTSYHETFGLTMLEEACAGVACVVPNHAVYPETHTGALLVALENVAAGIASLIDDPALWRQTARSSQQNALTYDIENVSSALASLAELAVTSRHSLRELDRLGAPATDHNP
jgi:glycosyltransferase involved in cell wall biosynthesis